MSSQAFLKISSIANGDSSTKEDDTLSLLTDPSNDKELILHYVNGLVKQHSLPVKQILSRFLDFIETSPNATIDEKITLYEDMIGIFTPPTTIVSLPYMKSILNLASIYESKADFTKSCELLKSIHVDTLVQDFATTLEFDVFRIELNTRIAKNSLKIDQIDDAEAYITRISVLLPNLAKNPAYQELTIDTLKTSIRIMVQLGKWLEASSRLFALDNEEFDLSVVKYAILAPYNNHKLNQFKKIAKSPHILKNVKNTPLYKIFNKILNKQLIYHEEYDSSLEFLVKTQALDGSEILLSEEFIRESYARAIVECNLIASAGIYQNTTIDNFTSFIKTDSDFVEEVTGEMIRDGRLSASIDDVDKIIEFGHSSLGKKRDDGLLQWHNHIIDLCSLLDGVVDKITHTDPQLAELVLTIE